MGDASHYKGMPHYKETRVAADDKLPLRVADHQVMSNKPTPRTSSRNIHACSTWFQVSQRAPMSGASSASD